MDDFEVFYKNHQKKLFSYLMRISGDYHLSMDIMQESFTRYFERYAKETRNVSLLYAIARNNFLDHKRKEGRSVSLEGEYKNPADSQVELLLIKEEYRQVILAMEKLEDGEREILSLVISGDLSYREIASMIGTSEGNIKVRVHRARVKLRNLLQN
jgi:RNA polymerase sigma-70 factor (ECF subfamily)